MRASLRREEPNSLQIDPESGQPQARATLTSERYNDLLGAVSGVSEEALRILWLSWFGERCDCNAKDRTPAARKGMDGSSLVGVACPHLEWSYRAIPPTRYASIEEWNAAPEKERGDLTILKIPVTKKLGDGQISQRTGIPIQALRAMRSDALRIVAENLGRRKTQ